MMTGYRRIIKMSNNNEYTKIDELSTQVGHVAKK